MMSSWVIFLLISVSGNNFKFYWHAGGTGLLTQNADVADFLEHGLGKCEKSLKS